MSQVRHFVSTTGIFPEFPQIGIGTGTEWETHALDSWLGSFGCYPSFPESAADPVIGLIVRTPWPCISCDQSVSNVFQLSKKYICSWFGYGTKCFSYMTKTLSFFSVFIHRLMFGRWRLCGHLDIVGRIKASMNRNKQNSYWNSRSFKCPLEVMLLSTFWFADKDFAFSIISC